MRRKGPPPSPDRPRRGKLRQGLQVEGQVPRRSRGDPDEQECTRSWRTGAQAARHHPQALPPEEAPAQHRPATPLHGPTGRAAGRPAGSSPTPAQGLPGRLSTHSGRQAIRPEAPCLFPQPQTSRAKKGEACPAVSGPSLRMDPHCPLGPLPLQAVLSDRSLGDMCWADGPL